MELLGQYLAYIVCAQLLLAVVNGIAIVTVFVIRWVSIFFGVWLNFTLVF